LCFILHLCRIQLGSSALSFSRLVISRVVIFKRSLDIELNDRFNQNVPSRKPSKRPPASSRPSRQVLNTTLAADTRQRLLTVAADRFAADGYAGTSVRDLAQDAEVNVAAISYHFGGKQQLYQECLRQVFIRAQDFWNAARQRQQHAAALGTPLAAEQAIRQHIHEFVRMLFRQETAFTLMLREFLEPTEALGQVVAEFIGPNTTILQALVDQLRPDLKGTVRLRAACGSIAGQCVNLRVARALIARLNRLDYLDATFLHRAAEQIADFSLASLRCTEESNPQRNIHSC
jgi:AcrR family transcriptional regulator